MDAFVTSDRDFLARAIVAGEPPITNADIRARELDRSRHALAYLKRKLGNEAMRDLLRDDLVEMTARVRGWVETSGGAWQSGSLELVVPGPSAKAFQGWYADAMARSREAELRAGHPEHFVSHPLPGTVEVVENVGETELPWRVFYRALPENSADFPSPWEADYPTRFGMELLDADGLRVGFSMRQSRDEQDGLRLKFTTHLPAAAPRELVQRHLHHFAIEFRNWTRFAWLEASGSADAAAHTLPAG